MQVSSAQALAGYVKEYSISHRGIIGQVLISDKNLLKMASILLILLLNSPSVMVFLEDY